LSSDIKSKIALFANLRPDQVVTARDVDNIYQLPLALAAEGLDSKACRFLKLRAKKLQLGAWKNFLDRIEHPHDRVSIAVVGKYTDQADSYKSLGEALIYAAAAHSLRLELHYIEATKLEGKSFAKVSDRENFLGMYDGILVP